MNDFMRPALYDAKHEIISVLKSKKRIDGNIEFVGPICESTDSFIKYKSYSLLNENNFVAITNVGAYGSSLSSNYNSKPLASEILVKKGKVKKGSAYDVHHKDKNPRNNNSKNITVVHRKVNRGKLRRKK